jgi:hypothetical protein
MKEDLSMSNAFDNHYGCSGNNVPNDNQNMYTNAGVATSGTLPGLAATMEVAGIESIPGAMVGPTMVGYTTEE